MTPPCHTKQTRQQLEMKWFRRGESKIFQIVRLNARTAREAKCLLNCLALKRGGIYNISYLVTMRVSCWVQVLILFCASMCVMSSVLSPLIARMMSPGQRSPWAALLPGVTCRSRAFTYNPYTAKGEKKKKKTCYQGCHTASEERQKLED